MLEAIPLSVVMSLYPRVEYSLQVPNRLQYRSVSEHKLIVPCLHCKSTVLHIVNYDPFELDKACAIKCVALLVDL